MKRILLILIAFFVFIAVDGQTPIRGTVTSAIDGKPIAGVKVSAGGLPPSISITGKNGQYLIYILGKANKLKFSKREFITKTVLISGNFVDAILEKAEDKGKEPNIKVNWKSFSFFQVKPDSTELADLSSIDSADIGYGLSENLNSSSSFKQVVKGELLNPAYQVNINNILAGKVAGLKIYGQSDMALGRTGAIGLRGQGGLSTGQIPVYYINGTYLSDINDINYNEIESVTVLGGPASTALLGSKAGNGAVLITTKKGESRVGKYGIEINSGIMFSKVYILPQYQDSYAGGYIHELQKYNYRPGFDPVEWQPLDGKYHLDSRDDGCWGPRMVGQEYIPWYSWYPGTKYTGTTAELVPQPHNIKDFYNTGVRINNDIAFSTSTEKFSLRSVVGNLDIKGTLPYTSRKRNSISVETSYRPVPRLNVVTDINFFTTKQEGNIEDRYGNYTTGSFNSWFHRDLDMGKLRELTDLRSPDNYLTGWTVSNPETYDPQHPGFFFLNNYWLNPYTSLKLTDITNRSDRLYGNISVSYQFAEGLNAEITYRRQQSTGWSESKVPLLFYTNWQSNYRSEYYSTGTFYRNQGNLTSLLTFTKKIRNFRLDIAGGFDFLESVVKNNSASTTEGLIIPELYTIQNSKGTPAVSNSRSDEKSRSLFARTALGYNDLLFIDMTIRKEWLSTLPPEDNSIIIKSFGAVLMLSKLIPIPIINSSKIRYAWGETSSGLDPYQYPGINYNYMKDSWNGAHLMQTPDNLVMNDIHGSIKRQGELGLEIDLYKNIAGISLNYWQGTESGIPQAIQIPGYSGFTSKLYNSGRIDKNGLDMKIIFRSYSSENLHVQTRLIFSRLINQKIVSVGSNIDKVSTLGLAWGPYLTMKAGRQWGELWGSGKKMINGKPVLDGTGHYVKDNDKYFGSVIPEITGGLQNMVTIFKDISVNIGIDYQFGGKFFSLSNMWGSYSGLMARTAGSNDKGNPVRDPVAEGGGIHVSGVDQTTGKDVDYYLEAMDYFHYSPSYRIYDDYIFNSSYIKLRELSISYRIPLKKLSTDKFHPDITVSLYSQNLWMIYAAQKNFDPSELTYIMGEEAQYPSIRSFGTNLKINF